MTNKNSDKLPERHPLNAPGPFYVEDGVCILCGTPSHTAPELMCSEEEIELAQSCYFKKQPTNQAETDQALAAVWSSCCGGLRYCGTDPAVIKRMAELGLSEHCDKKPDGQ